MAAATDHAMSDLLEVLQNTREDRSRMRFIKAWWASLSLTRSLSSVTARGWSLKTGRASWLRLSDHRLSCAQAVLILKQLFGLGDVGVQAAVVRGGCRGALPSPLWPCECA
jgi:hypothetical protein